MTALLDEKQAAERVGLPTREFCKLMKRQIGPKHIMLTARKRLYPAEDLDNWVASLQRVDWNDKATASR